MWFSSILYLCKHNQVQFLFLIKVLYLIVTWELCTCTLKGCKNAIIHLNCTLAIVYVSCKVTCSYLFQSTQYFLRNEQKWAIGFQQSKHIFMWLKRIQRFHCITLFSFITLRAWSLSDDFWQKLWWLWRWAGSDALSDVRCMMMDGWEARIETLLSSSVI